MADVEFTVNNCRTDELGDGAGRAPGHVRRSTHDKVHFKNLDATRKYNVSVPFGVLEGLTGAISLDEFPSANSSSYNVIGGVGQYLIGVAHTSGPGCPIAIFAPAPQIIIDD